MLVVLLWGTAATAFELALRWATPYQLLLWSVVVSTLVLGALLLRRGGVGQLRALPRMALLRGLALGVLNPFLYYLVLFAAYDRLPGQIAMALNYAWPLVLAVLAVPVLRQPLTRTQAVAIAVSFLGAVVIVTGGQLGFSGGLDTAGVLLALGSTVIWALFWLWSARDGADPVVKLFLGFVSGLVLALAAAPWLGGVGWAGLLPPVAAWPALVYVGLFEMGLTFVLWLTALQRARHAARLGHLVYLAPFLSLMVLHLVLGEPLLPATFIGLALIIGSLLWRAWIEGRRPAPTPAHRP
ncbi:MAG: EamA family transporter, partial [Gammaproteobacteria bacterium]|nr:EamA family transporter [Gammaproteobacteria bacterium]